MNIIKIRYCLLVLIYVGTGIMLNAQHFTIQNKSLIDANGKEFIIKGINNPHIWYKHRSLIALETISKFNTNCVRIVWETTGNASQLEKAISKCIEYKMIPMVELHDATGNASADRIMEMVEYYTNDEIKEILLRYEKYLLLNIANEWGDHKTTTEYWKETYLKAIDSLRKAGYKTTIVIDAPGWGQNINSILEAGTDMLYSDPLKNILFSVHMYGSWNDEKKISEKLQQAYDLNLPLIIGEFGYNYQNGDNNLTCKVNHKTILEKCNKLNYGYLPWSWTGNNEANAWLDLVDSTDWKTLTWWGKEVFEGKNGIKKTAKRASVFLE